METIPCVRVDGKWLRDEHGRALILRGVNLGGSSKVPVLPDGSSWILHGFYDSRDVSFVGRPFPLEEADEHLARLRAWGLRLLRLVVTWEAVEHAGPGIYDRDYLAYLRAVVESASRHGQLVIIDPHQDAWSRWSGGDGAPAWTLTEVGFRLETLHASGAAYLHQEVGNPFPTIIWPTNYDRLACATMFTLFFAGDTFAPGIRVRGEPVERFLQHRYTAAMKQVAESLRGLRNVVGFGAMNEPSMGYIGLRDVSRLDRATMRKGIMPTPFEAMRAGSGHHTYCGRWRLDLRGERLVGRADLNPTAARAWRDGEACVWERAGVWAETAGKPVLKRPGHFHTAGALADRFLKPFLLRFTREIRTVLPDAVLFVEGVPNADAPSWNTGAPAGVVHAPHWYDALTLLTRRYQELLSVDPRTRGLSLGPRAVRRSFAVQVARLAVESATRMGGLPTLIAEFGIPFDLAGGKAFRNGDFRRHTRALSAYYDALDGGLLGGAIWCYTADNDNRRGDHWNGEDLSIFSRDQARSGQADSERFPNAGARGLLGFCRPYAEKTAGTPLSMGFDARSRRFELSLVPDMGIRAPTVIYVPAAQYPDGYRVDLAPADSARAERDEADQRLRVHLIRALEPGAALKVRIRPDSQRSSAANASGSRSVTRIRRAG